MQQLVRFKRFWPLFNVCVHKKASTNIHLFHPCAHLYEEQLIFALFHEDLSPYGQATRE